jgi:hypothetical protein
VIAGAALRRAGDADAIANLNAADFRSDRFDDADAMSRISAIALALTLATNAAWFVAVAAAPQPDTKRGANVRVTQIAGPVRMTTCGR